MSDLNAEHVHKWQPHGLVTERFPVNSPYWGKGTYAVQSCSCGATRKVLVSRD